MSKDEFKKQLEKIRSKSEVDEAYLVGLLWYEPVNNYGTYHSKIEQSDFINDVWGFFYALGREMYSKGVKEFDDITVHATVKELGMEDLFRAYGNKRTVDEAVALVSGGYENIEYYFERLEKNTSIRKLIKLFGSKILLKKDKYDYEKMTTNQLLVYWTDQLNKISLDTLANYETENLYIDADEFIEDIEEGSANMLPWSNSYHLNSITQGIPKGEVTMFGGFGGSGKAIDSNGFVPTPDGWKKARDIQLGDRLFDRKGNPTNVVGVFPQGELEAYEVTLEDGRSFIVNDEHIIPYITSKNNISNKTLGEMLEDYKYTYYRKDRNVTETYNKYRVPNSLAVEYGEQELAIHPYALGVLIGDGYLHGKSGGIVISSDEKDIVEKFSRLMGLNMTNRSDYNYSWHFTQRDNSDGLVKEYLGEIDRLGLRVGSKEKFIPEQYLLGSKEQRLELLRGLMDTDGSVNVTPKGKVARMSFATSSEQLAKDVRQLAFSLGINNTLTIQDRGEKGIDYGVLLFTSQDIVTSEKHTSRLKDAKKYSKREKYSYIVNIEKVEPRDMVCFKVDNEEELFLMNDYIVTHNTSILADKYVMSCIENQEKLIIVLNEEDAHAFRQKIVLSILQREFYKGENRHVSRRKFSSGDLTEKDKENIRYAFRKFKELTEGDESQIKVVYMEKYTMDDLENIIRYWSNRGYDNLLVDTHKVTDDYSQDKRWEAFVEDTKRIHKMTRAEAGGLNLRTVISIQLSDASLNERFLGYTAIGEGKAAKNEASILIMFRPLFGDEYDDLDVYRNVMENGVFKGREKIHLEKEKSYYLFFVPKNRFGQNTDNGQPILVVEPNFEFNEFKEIGWTNIARTYM